ncbi:MAG: PorP/SprF family type IX secretion system membrane protein, partial [Crocinitomicaceae bacterium]|nr:PorP/SprF family type IX secretion system membrane protein [Crocinitomicaceae bacterium]
MKQFSIHIIFLFVSATAIAQQLPQYTYFTYNYINYNPAVTGQTPCLEMKIGYRRQWTGIPEAPKTGYVVAHGKIGVKKRSFHGIGMLVDNDVAGPFSTTSMFANYAFHLKLNRSYTLASGIGIGFSQYRVNYGAMIMEFQNADPAINGTVNNFIFPQINAGLWLYKPNQFYGFSVRQIKPNDIKGLGDS